MKKNNNTVISHSYNRVRIIVFVFLLLAVSFMTIGYASYYGSILSMKGIIGLSGDNKDLEIIEVSVIDSLNVNSNNEDFYVSNDSSDSEKILVVDFNLDFYRAQGSGTSYIKYKIIVKNNSLVSRTFSDYTSNYSFNGEEATYSYKLSGATKGTAIIDPGETLELTLTLTLTDTVRTTHYYLTENFKLYFGEVSLDDFRLYSVLNTKEVSFNTFSDLIPVSIKVINKSMNDAVYNVSTNNDNFVFVSNDGSALEHFTIEANSSEEIEVYLAVDDDHFLVDTVHDLDVVINTISPNILTYDVGNIVVSLPESKFLNILSGKTIYDASTINFLSTSSNAGIYKAIENDDTVYFYRGNVVNNYVSFAGLTWRIMRIDKYGVRIILQGSAGSSKWANSNTVNDSGATGLVEAKEVLDYDNSIVKTNLDSWFNSNLIDYKNSGIIKKSNFCVDNSTVIMTGSQTQNQVYYFGSYKRIGSDTTNYTPLFYCTSQYNREYDVGLISADEVAFAGGVFNTNSTNYYLYWNTGVWWTISPSYYDSGASLKTVSVFYVTSTGNLTDWPDANLVAGSRYIRPVITLDIERLTGGSGTSNNPYTFN